MPALPVSFNQALKDEYNKLFADATVHSNRLHLLDHRVAQIVANKPRYAAVAKATGVPWFVIAIIHSMEGGGSFTKHLHNGDPLTARTTHVPAGRPLTGGPPFTWETSATDAIEIRHLNRWKDWSVAGILWQLEGFNGLGYRQYHPNVKSPYLWSFTDRYTKGKYVADGKWSSEAVSQQIGAAALLKRGIQLGHFKV